MCRARLFVDMDSYTQPPPRSLMTRPSMLVPHYVEACLESVAIDAIIRIHLDMAWPIQRRPRDAIATSITRVTNGSGAFR
jgi:hypothetical protein